MSEGVGGSECEYIWEYEFMLFRKGKIAHDNNYLSFICLYECLICVYKVHVASFYVLVNCMKDFRNKLLGRYYMACL